MPQNEQNESPPAALEPCVHALQHGMALCGQLEGVPAEWPEGQTWIAAAYLEKLAHVTCEKCRSEYRVMFPRSTLS